MSVVGGDSTAVGFAREACAHRETMGHLVARLVPDVPRDDVVQDALIRAWQRRGDFDPARGTLRAWLCAIALDQARQHRRRLRPVPHAGFATAPGHDSDVRIDLDRALAQLPPRQRQAVDLVYVVGLTVSEAAVVMGCAAGTVKSTLSDARARLRPLLEVAS